MRLHKIVVGCLTLAVLTVAAPVAGAGVAQDIPQVAAAKTKKKKKKPTPAVTYVAKGVIAETNVDEDEFTLELNDRSRTLRRVAKNGQTFTFTLSEKTEFTVDGDEDVELADVCAGDNARVTFTTRKKVSESGVYTVAKVAVTTDPANDCAEDFEDEEDYDESEEDEDYDESEEDEGA